VLSEIERYENFDFNGDRLSLLVDARGRFVGVYLQPFPTRPAVAGWLAFVAQLVADVKAHGFGLVVFDTLAKLWPVQEENDASAVDAALMPLWDVCKTGASVLLIHHLRKSGGGEYTGSRGSGALSAFPDILVELTRFDAKDNKCRKRLLHAKGRYEETPDELTIELVDGEYTVVRGAEPTINATPDGERLDTVALNTAGESGDASNREASILDILRKHGWCTADAVRERLAAAGRGMRAQTVSDTLAGLLNKSQVKTAGKLRSKTAPRLWALPDADDLVPSLCVTGSETVERDDSRPEDSRSQISFPFNTQDRNEADDNITPDWRVELLLILARNGPLSAAGLNEVCGRGEGEVESAMRSFVGDGKACETDGVFWVADRPLPGGVSC
jgi:hypothetical protein